MKKKPKSLKRNPKKKKVLSPILDGLAAAGLIWIDSHGEYVGVARDGVEVSLGMVGYEADVERYLRAHPTPADW